MEILRFTNGSDIIPLPSTTYIRGYQNINYICCDEAAFFANPEQVFASIEPMLSIRNKNTGEYGSLILISSPNGCTGKFYEMYNNALYSQMQIPSERNNYISEEWLDEQKKIMSGNVYRQEILAEFIAATDNFFSPELVDKCSQEYDFTNFPDPEKKYFLGVDIGRVKDSSVLLVCSVDSEQTKKVEKIIELQDCPFESQINHIKMLHQRFKFRKVTIEQAGLSMPVVERLRYMQIPLFRFVPTIDRKAEAYNNLLAEMEQGNIIIPKKSETLIYQMKTFRYEVTARGKMKLHHTSDAVGDDFVDALCYAIWGTMKPAPLITSIGRRSPTDFLKNPIILFNEKKNTYERKPMTEITWGEKLKTYKKGKSFNYSGI